MSREYKTGFVISGTNQTYTATVVSCTYLYNSPCMFVQMKEVKIVAVCLSPVCIHNLAYDVTIAKHFNLSTKCI